MPENRLPTESPFLHAIEGALDHSTSQEAVEQLAQQILPMTKKVMERVYSSTSNHFHSIHNGELAPQNSYTDKLILAVVGDQLKKSGLLEELNLETSIVVRAVITAVQRVREKSDIGRSEKSRTHNSKP